MSTDSSYISGGIGHSNREGREDWFKRLKEYERENGMKLDDMVSTIVDMRRRDNQQKQLQETKSKEAEEDSDIVFEVSCIEIGVHALLTWFTHHLLKLTYISVFARWPSLFSYKEFE